MADNRKLLTPELQDRVIARVKECFDRATALWPIHADKFAIMPEIRYDIKNKFGGMAISGGAEDWTIRLNLILCYENEADFIEQTVGHEVAHLVQRVVFGLTKKVEGPKGVFTTKRVQSHGPEWREVMTKFGLKPRRCHTYDTSSIQVKSRVRKLAAPLPAAELIAVKQQKLKRRLQRDFLQLALEDQQLFADWCASITME